MNNNETPTGWGWLETDVKLAIDGERRFIALAVDGEIIAMIEHEKVMAVLWKLGDS